MGNLSYILYSEYKEFVVFMVCFRSVYRWYCRIRKYTLMPLFRLLQSGSSKYDRTELSYSSLFHTYTNVKRVRIFERHRSVRNLDSRNILVCLRESHCPSVKNYICTYCRRLKFCDVTSLWPNFFRTCDITVFVKIEHKMRLIIIPSTVEIK